MKKTYLLLAALFMLLPSALRAQTDMTSKIQNADLSSNEGWTITCTEGQNWATQKGTAPYNVSEAYAGWGNLALTEYSISTKVVLPKGAYELSAYGFYRYGNEKWTVLRVDGFSRIYYEIDEDGGYDTLEEDAFLDDCFIAALGLNALWQLKRNAEKRNAEHGEVSSEDGSLDGTVDESTGDILEGIIEQEEKAEEHTHLLKAWATLTDQQKAVIWMIKVKGLTQEDVAKRIGVSRPRVAAVLRQTIEKLQKNI